MIPALIVPILTRVELLEKMLSTIDYPIGHLVVIDNGKCVDWVPPIAKAGDQTLVTLPANLGVAGSWNLGIKTTPFAQWWLIANFDITFPPGALAALADSARPDAVTLVDDPVSPWCCFTIGQDVVDRVGLFSEAYHPAYFEDLDYSRRVKAAGMDVVRTGIHVDHDSSATLRSGYQSRNHETFNVNAALYNATCDTPAEQPWSLERRRGLSWD